ncbi:WD40 repeat-like protein [Rhizopogon salebrosus TDB-379]|nr:WD40 repeat-like protein [Rhizopogon salebrosus TDB-379]
MFLEKLQLEAVLETQFSGRSNSPAPSSDKKGKKRAIAESDVTSARLRKRLRTLPIQQSMYSTLTKALDVENMWKRPHPWPIYKSVYSRRIKSDGDAGVKEIVFSADGERMAVVCHDRTIRIWSVLKRVETACLKQNSAISSVAWRVDGNAVITLGQDGVVSKWTQNKQNDWHWVKLLRTGKKEPTCFASKRDRLAVAFPQFGVKVWLWMKGTWQPQRSILQQNVTCIKFVEDGNALLGGTSDGIFWYCQVPNGTLRSCANLKAKIQSPIDVRESEIYLLPAENYERLGRFLEMGSKGKIGVVRAPNDERQTSPALVITRDFCVVFHSVESDCLVWDNTTSSVVHCLDHGENERPQVVAGFDHSCIVTGTAQGLLSWWNDLAASRSRSTQEPLCTGIACGGP